MFMQDTYWRNKLIRRKKTSLTKYLYLSLYCKGSKKVVWGFTVRGSWRPNITEIFWPQSYGRQRCVFLVLQDCSTGALKSTLLGAGFPYQHSSTSLSNSTAWLLSWLSYIIVQRPLDRPRDLWNRKFKRHQVEITVMQFRCHSLPVRQSMRV